MEGKNEPKKPMTIDDLIEVLKKKREEHGHMNVVVDTQEGWAYSLFGEDAVSVVESMTMPECEMVKSLQIG